MFGSFFLTEIMLIGPPGNDGVGLPGRQGERGEPGKPGKEKKSYKHVSKLFCWYF